METILIIAGVVLLIINITMVVKFFQIAGDLRELRNLYVYGKKSISDDRIPFENGSNDVHIYYKLPIDEITEREYMNKYEDLINKKIEERTCTK